MTSKEHRIYGLDIEDIDTVISFMTQNKDRMSIKDKETLITLVELRYNSKGAEFT